MRRAPLSTPNPSNSQSSTNARPPAIRPADWLGVVEQLVEQVVPLFLEREAALEFVEHGEARGQACLDREVEQDAAGEGVQRADRRMVEASERCVGVGTGLGFEALPGAAAQLGGSLLGECDRGDPGDRDARAHEVDDAGHQ